MEEVELELNESVLENKVKDQPLQLDEETDQKMDELVSLIESKVISALLETEIQYLLNEVVKRDKPKEILGEKLPETNNESSV